VDVLRGNAVVELYRASIRVYTVQTTLYLVAEPSHRGCYDMGLAYSRELERDLLGPEVNQATFCTRWFARVRREALGRSESMEFCLRLLHRALFRWPQRVGEIEVYRVVSLGDGEVDTYREVICKVIGRDSCRRRCRDALQSASGSFS
jgi:hypothetical protein